MARQERTTVATLLEQIVIDWLTLHQAERNQDESEQRRLHAAAARSLGTIRGANPHRSEHVRDAIRARLSKRHAH